MGGMIAYKDDEIFLVRHKPADRNEGNITINIFEDKSKVRVIVELPGVNENDINLELNGDKLFLFANRENIGYRKEIKLPRVCEDMTWKLFDAEILEIMLT